MRIRSLTISKRSFTSRPTLPLKQHWYPWIRICIRNAYSSVIAVALFARSRPLYHDMPAAEGVNIYWTFELPTFGPLTKSKEHGEPPPPSSQYVPTLCVRFIMCMCNHLLKDVIALAGASEVEPFSAVSYFHTIWREKPRDVFQSLNLISFWEEHVNLGWIRA